MEFLKRVVGHHQGARLLGDAQDESVPAPNRARRRRDHLAVLESLLECGHLRRVDPVTEGGVDHHRHIGGGEAAILLQKAPDGLVQLGQAGKGATLGSDI